MSIFKAFHSYIVVSSHERELAEYLGAFKKEGVHPADMFDLTQQASVGIADIRKLRLFLSQKPFAAEFKVVLISGETLTFEAQNAFLKTLEEPPRQSGIVIIVKSIEVLLPTLVSRCRIITLNTPIRTIAASESSAFWQKLLTAGIGHRLEYAADISQNREVTRVWLHHEIEFLRQELLDLYLNGERQHFSLITISIILKRLIRAYDLVSRNVSPKLVLDELFLSLPKVRKEKA